MPFDLPEIPEHLLDYVHMPLGEILEQHGTDTRFVDFLRARKYLESIQQIEIKNAQAAGDLISRSLVKVGVIEPVDTALKKLLTEKYK